MSNRGKKRDARQTTVRRPIGLTYLGLRGFGTVIIPRHPPTCICLLCRALRASHALNEWDQAVEDSL